AQALRKLSEASYADEAMMQDAVRRKGEFNFIDGDTGVKVDFWATKHDEYSLLKLKRRVPRKISGKTVYFISPEDLILSKLIWHKMSESSRQLEDIESILKISGKKLDMEYIKKWAEHLGVLTIFRASLKKR
ncbi:MAG: hypothetical protein HYW96_00590, partial [Candidatus Wildermuthbacteria bacterium]|nr:hypothetical protein [Candidatus Wildermuthbacteria bacterium]